MNRAERDAVGRMFDSLSSLGNLHDAKTHTLEAFCTVADAACGQLTDNQAWLREAKIADVGYASPRWCSSAEFKRMLKVYQALVYPDDFSQFFELLKSPHAVIAHSQLENRERIYASGFYRKFMAPFGLTEGCSIFLRAAPDPCRFSMGISSRRPNGFDRRRLQELAALVPSTGRCLDNLAQWHERKEAQRSLTQVVSESSELLVMLARRRGGKSYGVAALSNPAAKLLALGVSSSYRDPYLQEFLQLAPRSLGSSATALLWTARNGRVFQLSSLLAKMPGEPLLLLIRLQPLERRGPSASDDRTAALQRGLSPREAEVFVNLAQGKSNKEIAVEMRLSYDTVRAHVRNIFSKLQVAGRMEAINAVRGVGQRSGTA